MKLISIEQRILDKYQNYGTAWSLRRLRSGYNGACIRIRRSEDNAEQDISFVNDLVDTASVESFLSARNLFLRSQELDNAYWDKQLATVTANATTDPLGGSTADRVNETATTGSHGFQLSALSDFLIKGHSYVYSMYVKTNTDSWVQIGGLTATFGVDQWANFDIVNGVIGNRGSSTSLSDCSITSVGSGWFRISIRMTALETTTTNAYFRLTNDVDTTTRAVSYAGNTGSSVFIWGQQLEMGTTLSAYQATTTTPYGIGYVTTVYDQSGAGIDLVQATAVNQPIVAFGGAVNCNGKPAMLFQGGQSIVANNAASYWKKYHDGTIEWSVLFIQQYGVTTNPNTVYRGFATGVATSAEGIVSDYRNRTGTEINRVNFTVQRAVANTLFINIRKDNSIVSNQQNILFANINPTVTGANRGRLSLNNGTDVTNTSSSSFSSGDPEHTLWVGNLPANSFPLVGFIQELVFWDERKTKANIFGDFNSYWQAY